MKAFPAAGLGCHRIDTLEAIRHRYLHEVVSDQLDDDWDDGRSISVVRMMDHPVGGFVDTVPPAYVRLRNAPIRLLGPAPKQGRDTREILLELGYSPAQIDQWICEEVVKEEFHEAFLPA